jgi:hypothetical protein
MALSSCARRNVAATALSAGAALLVAGCGAGSPSASVTTAGSSSPAATTAPVAAARSPHGPNSCSVITQAQASAALGQPVQPPKRGKAQVEKGVACVFFGPDVPPGTSASDAGLDAVRVVLVTGQKAEKFFANYRSQVHAQAISGLGDQAFYDGGASISVLKGNAYVRIAIGKPDNLSAEEALARDALPKM